MFTQEVLCQNLHSKGVWLRHHHDKQENCYICIRVAQMFKLSNVGRKWKLNFVTWYSTFRVFSLNQQSEYNVFSIS